MGKCRQNKWFEFTAQCLPYRGKMSSAQFHKESRKSVLSVAFGCFPSSTKLSVCKKVTNTNHSSSPERWCVPALNMKIYIHFSGLPAESLCISQTRPLCRRFSVLKLTEYLEELWANYNQFKSEQMLKSHRG